MLEIGREFDGYVIEAEIGRGTTGIVYRARDSVRGEPRALKVGTGEDARVLARAWIEGRYLALVDHPNVVALFEVLALGERPVLVLEYADGGTLAERLADGPLDPESVDALAEALISGLDALHRADLIHRDLKPANVLLAGPDRAPKISDLGLALLGGVEPSSTVRIRKLGTPRYMAPEQWVDPRCVDVRADLFSLGCLLYEALAGVPAFPGDDPDLVALRIAAGRWIPLPRLRPDLPKRMVDTIHACLSVFPEDRPPSCGVLRRRWRGSPLSARFRVGRRLRLRFRVLHALNAIPIARA